jgi:hypothetical protein
MNGVFTLAQLSPPLARGDLAHMRANPRSTRAIHTAKHDSLPGLSGAESNATRDAQMQANALEHGRSRERAPTHLDSEESSSFSKRLIMPANLNNAAEARSDSR